MEILQAVGYALGGRAGKRLGVRLGLQISGDALLRRVKKAAKARPHSIPILVVGVDEWAWRKGYSSYRAPIRAPARPGYCAIPFKEIIFAWNLD
jgi:hypothetical protein